MSRLDGGAAPELGSVGARARSLCPSQKRASERELGESAVVRISLAAHAERRMGGCRRSGRRRWMKEVQRLRGEKLARKRERASGAALARPPARCLSAPKAGSRCLARRRRPSSRPPSPPPRLSLRTVLPPHRRTAASSLRRDKFLSSPRVALPGASTLLAAPTLPGCACVSHRRPLARLAPQLPRAAEPRPAQQALLRLAALSALARGRRHEGAPPGQACRQSAEC